MALLDENYENTTTVIGVQNNNQPEPNWIATGFFVGVKDKNGPGSYVYLVTNKHVIMDVINQHYQSMKIRVHLKTGTIQPIDVTLIQGNKNRYLCSPSKEVDVAVIALNGRVFESVLDKVAFFDLDDNALLAKDYLNEGGFEGSPVPPLWQKVKRNSKAS